MTCPDCHGQMATIEPNYHYLCPCGTSMIRMGHALYSTPPFIEGPITNERKYSS